MRGTVESTRVRRRAPINILDSMTSWRVSGRPWGGWRCSMGTVRQHRSA